MKSLIKISGFTAFSYLVYAKLDNKTWVISGNPSSNIIVELSNKKYFSPFLLPTCLLQMIMNQKFNGFKDHSRVAYKRSYLNTDDGGLLSIDEYIKKSESTPKRLILVMHGLTGGSNTCYIKDICEGLEKCEDSRILCVNYRGVNKTPLKNSTTYHAGYTHDLEEILHYIKVKYPNEPLYLVGTSMGANIITNLMGQSKKPLPEIKGFVSISNPINIVELERRNEDHIVDSFLTKRWKSYINEHYSILKEDKRIDVDYILSNKIKRYRDFDREFTCKLFDFIDPDDYYKKAECKEYIQGISVPTLFINSLDDLLSPIDSIDYKSICKSIIINYLVTSNPNLTLVLTKRGGHCCWFKTSYKNKKFEFDRVSS